MKVSGVSGLEELPEQNRVLTSLENGLAELGVGVVVLGLGLEQNQPLSLRGEREGVREEGAG